MGTLMLGDCDKDSDGDFDVRGDFAHSYITNLILSYHPNHLLCYSQDTLPSSSLVPSSNAHLQDISRTSSILWNFLPVCPVSSYPVCL